MKRTSRILLAAVAAVSLGLMPTAANAEGGGHKTPFEIDYTTVVNSLCGFPVTISGHAEGFVIETETANYTLSMLHAYEVDVFSANGNELTSVPYRFTNHFTIDDQGNVLSAYQTGVLIKVPLATGQTFLVAGRADFLTITEDFVSVPTHGVTRNLDAFCAALSG